MSITHLGFCLFVCIFVLNRDIEDALLKGENPNEISSDDGVCAMHVAAGLGEKATSLLLQHGGCPNIEYNKFFFLLLYYWTETLKWI